MTKAGLDPANDVTLVQQQFDMQALLKRRHRRRPGHDLQRVRPGAGGQEPGHRQALHARRLRRSSTGTTSARRCSRTPSGPTPTSSQRRRSTRTRRSSSSRRRSKGWVFCRDNPRSAATSCVAKGSKLGASHQLWQMNEINKLIWPSPERHRHHRRQGRGTRRSTSRSTPRTPRARRCITEAARRRRLHQRVRGRGAGPAEATRTRPASSFKPLTVTLNEGGA